MPTMLYSLVIGTTLLLLGGLMTTSVSDGERMQISRLFSPASTADHHPAPASLGRQEAEARGPPATVNRETDTEDGRKYDTSSDTSVSYLQFSSHPLTTTNDTSPVASTAVRLGQTAHFSQMSGYDAWGKVSGYIGYTKEQQRKKTPSETRAFPKSQDARGQTEQAPVKTEEPSPAVTSARCLNRCPNSTDSTIDIGERSRRDVHGESPAETARQETRTIYSRYQNKYHNTTAHYCPLSNFCGTEALRQLGDEHQGLVPCCTVCSCRDDCVVKGNCCPDKPVEGPYETKAQQATCMTPHYPSARYSGKSYFVFDSCPDNYTDVYVTSMCSDPTYDGIFDTVADVEFVSDNETNTIYKNRFCAECNGVLRHNPWEISSTVCHNSDLFNSIGRNGLETLERLLNDIGKLDCEFTFKPPSNANTELEECFVDVTRTCNVTGSWDRYDADIEALCGAFEMPYRHEAPFFGDSVVTLVFANVYCFLCNQPSGIPLSDTCQAPSDSGNMANVFAPYSIVLDLKALLDLFTSTSGEGKGRTQQPRCGQELVFNPQSGRCEWLVCPMYQVRHNGECVTFLQDFSYLGIKQTFKVTSNVSLTTFISPTLFEYVGAYFKEQSMMAKQGCAVAKQCSLDFFVNDSDEYSLFIDLFVETRTHVLTCSAHALLEMMHDYLKKGGGFEVNHEWLHIPFSITMTPGVHTADMRPVLKSTSACGKYVTLPSTFYCSLFADLSQTDLKDLSCPGQSVASSSDLQTKASDKRGTASTLGYLSSAVVITSLTCAVLTIVAFLCFKELRHGRTYIIILVLVNLCLAQAFFEFGITLTEMGVFCVIIGIGVHFFHMAYICSLSCYMILVFNSMRNTAAFRADSCARTSKKFIVSCSIYLVPLALVAINVVVSYFFETPGARFGYGGNMCYISTALMRLLVFAVPLFCCIVLNIVIFCLTVRIMHTVQSRLESVCSTEREYLGVYMKLLMFTGVTWLLGFLYEILQYDFLEYLFVLLNAGNGILTMVCFLCRRSVYRVFRERLQSSFKTTKTKTTIPLTVKQ